MDYSSPGSPVHGILQARILEWVAMPFSRDLPDPGMELEAQHSENEDHGILLEPKTISFQLEELSFHSRSFLLQQT